METRLQSVLVENKNLKEKCKYVESRSETAMRKHEPRPQGVMQGKMHLQQRRNTKWSL